MQHLEKCLANEFSHIQLWPTVKEPVQLFKSKVTLVVPDKSTGWNIVPDRIPCDVSQTLMTSISAFHHLKAVKLEVWMCMYVLLYLINFTPSDLTERSGPSPAHSRW